MSEAFKQQWLRMSPNKRLLTLLMALAKSGPLFFSTADLEAVQPGEVLAQSFVADGLEIRRCESGMQMFVMGESQEIAERKATWPGRESESVIPERLSEVLEGVRTPVVTTTNDAEMAARESLMNMQSRARQESIRRRQQPLPVTQPAHPPS